MENWSLALQALDPVMAEKIKELSPDAIADMMLAMVDPIKAKALLEADADDSQKDGAQASGAATAEADQAAKKAAQDAETLEKLQKLLGVTAKKPKEEKKEAPIPTPEEMLARMAASLATVAKSAESKEKDEVKAWTTKAYEAQYNFNLSVKKLIKANELVEAAAKIDARNADLVLADPDPAVLPVLDKAKAYAEASGQSMGNALMLSILADRRRSSGGSRPAKRPYSARGAAGSSSKARCYKCDQIGHLAVSCSATP